MHIFFLKVSIRRKLKHWSSFDDLLRCLVYLSGGSARGVTVFTNLQAFEWKSILFLKSILNCKINIEVYNQFTSYTLQYWTVKLIQDCTIISPYILFDNHFYKPLKKSKARVVGDDNLGPTIHKKLITWYFYFVQNPKCNNQMLTFKLSSCTGWSFQCWWLL